MNKVITKTKSVNEILKEIICKIVDFLEEQDFLTMKGLKDASNYITQETCKIITQLCATMGMIYSYIIFSGVLITPAVIQQTIKIFFIVSILFALKMYFGVCLYDLFNLILSIRILPMIWNTFEMIEMDSSFLSRLNIIREENYMIILVLTIISYVIEIVKTKFFTKNITISQIKQN